MLRGRLSRLIALGLIALTMLPSSAALAGSAPLLQPVALDLALQLESDGVTIDLATPDYLLQEVDRDGQSFHEIVLAAEGWAYSAQAGAPQLPQRSVLLAVPPEGEVTVELLAVVAGTDQSGIRVQPAPLAELAGDELQTRWEIDPDSYRQGGWLPAVQAEITEEGWMRGHRFVRLALRPFQVDAAAGHLRVAESMQVRVRFAETGVNGRVVASDPIYQPVFRSLFANYAQAAGWQVQPEQQAVRSPNSGNWVKVTVNSDGIYRLTYNHLLGAGLSPATLSAISPATMRLLDNGVEQRVYLGGNGTGGFDPGDFVQFYGQRNRASHSDDNNVYWLTWGGANGLRMVQDNGGPVGAANATALRTTARAEENLVYHAQRPFTTWLAPALYDHWYWEDVTTNKTVTFSAMQADTSSAAQPILSLWLAGEKELAGNYTVGVALNGQPEQELTWASTKILDGAYPLPAGALATGSNNLTLRPINSAGQTGLDWTFWLDWLELTYPYNGTYISGSTFWNANPGVWRYRISGFPTSVPWIFNVADPSAPRQIINASTTPSGGAFDLTWELTTTPADRFLVVPVAGMKAPAAVEVAVDAGLLDTNQQVDYLIIGHESLLPAVQPLADRHINVSGYSVKMVDVQDVYDAFSDGSVAFEAIHDYLGYVYNNYQWPAPAFVLLAGDGTVDPRGYQYSLYGHANLVPPRVGGFDAWGGTSVADNAYAFIQGADLLGEMIVSRLPVNTPAEATVVVDKSLNYAADFPADRLNSTLWVTDNPDNDNPVYGTQFFMAADDTIAELPAGYTSDKVYFCKPGINACPPDPDYYTDLASARSAIKSKISDGHLLLYYTGHGSITTWAHEQLFRSYSDWVDPLTNGTALPFLLVSSCTNGFFADARYNGIDEVLLRTADKGTIGGFSGVTFDTLPPQTHMLKEFVRVVMHEGITQTGVAAAVARGRSYTELIYPENERTAVGHGLSGDPALALAGVESCVEGDLDCDGNFDIVDVQLVAAAWNTSAWGAGYNPRADLVPNGRIEVDDIQAAAALWQTPIAP